MTKSKAVNLPTDIRPTDYDLTLTPNFTDFTFTGHETVKINIKNTTSTIVMNSAELDIKVCQLTVGNAPPLKPTHIKMNENEETATFLFEEILPVGEASLYLEFTGELNDKLRGFYRSKYTTTEGEDAYIATTQFEATDARRAFPCWDEPAIKSRFQVTLIIPQDMVAVSNTALISETKVSTRLSKKQFGKTPIMSTYLLAFVIGDIKSIQSRADNGTLMRVWATAGKEEHGQFALEVSIQLLEYFNNYFGIPYPLEKLDHLAIPDFAAGAMENWGAITYRENALLVDPNSSSAMTRQTVASIIAHEMAHMWFGDLVTMAWWNDLWLNESFASWMGDKAVDSLFPEWEVWTQFVSNDTNRGLSLDGLQNSHPIEQEVNNPAEIGQLFDAISYSKGGSILRMLENFIGEDKFRNGLKKYLEQHQYGNARTEDLWAALEKASGEPVSSIMDSWVKQTGYPVINVKTSRQGDTIKVTTKQTRFTYDHLLDPNISNESVWHVPFSLSLGSDNHRVQQLIETHSALLRTRVPIDHTDEDWIKSNPGQTGFYRVNYSPEDWTKFKKPIQTLELPPIDRLGIQNDSYALSRAGYLPVTEFLDLVETYVNEVNATVWSDLASNLSGLDSMLQQEPYYHQYENFCQSIFQKVGRDVGWEPKLGEGHLESLLRSTALMELGRYGYKDTLSMANQLFEQYNRDPSRINPDIRSVIFNLAAKQGDISTHTELWKLYKNAELQEEKTRLLTALTHLELPKLLEKSLYHSLSEHVRVHDTIRVVVGVASNPVGRDIAWDFVKDNWKEFDRRYGEGGFALMSLVSITSRFTTQEKLDDVQQFFEVHPVPSALRTIEQSLERVKLNIEWLKQNSSGLSRWLGSYEQRRY